MLTRLRARPRTLRLYSSLAFENEEKEFANRKPLIHTNPEWYYPTLAQLRPKDLPRLRVPEFRTRFEEFQWPEKTKRIEDVYVLEGRITSIRKSGKGMVFLDLTQDMTKVQVVLMNKLIGEDKDAFAEYHEQFKKGDHVLAIGHPGVTNVGELSLKATQRLRMASPIMHPIPPKLVDSAKRHGNRVVDYLVNKRSKEIIIVRAKIVREIRNFLEERGFMEVETPIIAHNTKGANATPFTTSSQHIKRDDKPLELQLRVAPELWLKKLVISGFDKVFELGKVFRNEGIDGTHNPEFTTCEFYQSFTSLEELMEMSEQLFQQVGEEMLKYEITRPQAERLLSQPFKKLEFIPSIEKATGLPFPSELTVESLTSYYNEIQLPLPPTKSIPHLLDRLSSHFLEPQCDSPTFIYHQPSAMSPLSKSTEMTYSGRSYDISRRFELFIQGAEYVNAYEEENSPTTQHAKFSLQQQLKDSFKDEESIVPDHKYLEAMEWGLPPTGGWGLGVDRLCMLLVGEKRIEEVLTFGALPDVTRQ